MKVIGPCPAQTSQPRLQQESLADQVRVLVKTASSEETIVLKPEVTEHEFHDLTPATWRRKVYGEMFKVIDSPPVVGALDFFLLFP